MVNKIFGDDLGKIRQNLDRPRWKNHMSETPKINAKAKQKIRAHRLLLLTFIYIIVREFSRGINGTGYQVKAKAK